MAVITSGGLVEAGKQLTRIQELLDSGKVQEALERLPEIHRAGAQHRIERVIQSACEKIDAIPGVIHAQVGLPEAEALHRDLVDEHG